MLHNGKVSQKIHPLSIWPCSVQTQMLHSNRLELYTNTIPFIIVQFSIIIFGFRVDSFIKLKINLSLQLFKIVFIKQIIFLFSLHTIFFLKKLMFLIVLYSLVLISRYLLQFIIKKCFSAIDSLVFTKLSVHNHSKQIAIL